MSYFFHGMGLAWSWAFPSSIHPLTSSRVDWHSYHIIIWLVLTRTLLGLLYAFLLLNSSSPLLSLGLYPCCFGLPWPISSLLGSLGPFYSFGHPSPVSFPSASPAHSNPSFPWAFAKIFGLPQLKLLYPLLLGFIGFSTNPYLLNSLIWALLAHSYLLSISHNAHRFTTYFFGFVWACLLSLRPFYYFTGLWSIIPAIQV